MTAPTLDFWFDPTCPFTWNTALWVREAAPQRGTEVRWRPFSLKFKNEGHEVPEPVRIGMQLGLSSLRVVQHLIASGREDAVDRLYLELGRRLHHDDVERGPKVLADSAEAAGLPAEDLEAADDESFDAGIRESMAEALGMVGDDVGVPILSFRTEPRQAFFGPVVSPPPKGEDALRLWDSFATAVTLPGFFELKRSRHGLEIGDRP